MSISLLKPCPFCGGMADIRNVSNNYSGGMFSSVFEIGCKSCKIGFRRTSYYVIRDGMPIISIDGYKDCIDIWNIRFENGK